MRIRAAVAGDLPAVQALVAAAYGHYVARIGKQPAPMTDDYAARIAAGECFVAEAAGAVAGLIVLEAAAGALQVDNVAVAPARQGQGVGRALLAFAEHEARRRGITRLTLYTHEKMTENLAMYPAMGWRETGRAQQAGFARVFFEKSL